MSTPLIALRGVSREYAVGTQRVRALIEQLARGETPEKLSYMPEALFTADTLTAELLESRVY